MTPDWLTRSLGPRWLQDAKVEKVACEPLGEGEGFVGQIARLRLSLDRDAPDAPRSLVVKLPTTVATNRATGEMFGSYEREILFYRELAPRVPYRTPRLYYADMDENPASKYGPAIVRFIDRLPGWLMRLVMAFFYFLARHSGRRYVLLLEDLAAAQLGDQVSGRSADACLPVVRAMARAQAAMWRSPLLEDRYWVARMEVGLRVGQQMARGSRPGFEQRFASRLRAEDRAALDWLELHAEGLLRELNARIPATLVHGDFRLDNLLFDGGEDPLVVDWQGVARGPGVVDLAYFLSGSLPPETSQEDELALVRAYHETLVASGVSDYDFETCLRDYRRFVVLLLQRIVTLDWVDLGQERGAELIDRWVERILARMRGIDREALLHSGEESDELNDPCILYGSYASYATAKTRSYLRKKGIPFVERLPAHPRFREHVRPESGSHRIPQLELPDGSVVQDTVEILDTLEARFPEPPVYPPGPRQGLAARLFEVMIDGLLGRPAWHYRWNFMQENYRFVGREFGRSFRPQGSDEELDHYGRVIADRMEGKREGLGATDALLPVFEAIYADTLDLLEVHFTSTPYLFGGLPSVADFALMGPLFGHLARDPQPATLMKLRAPRVFRWTEAMNTPEIQSPEFADVPAEFLPDDVVPEQTQELLRLCCRDGGAELPRSAEIYNEWVSERRDLPPGSPVSEKADEPVLGRFESALRGVPAQAGAALYPLWVLQRALDWFASQDAASQAAGRKLLAECGGEALLDIRLARPLRRVNSRIALG